MEDRDLAFASAWDQRELISSKQVSPVELAQLYFDRIEALDSQLNSYLTLTYDAAMKTAKSAEEAVVRGDKLGPLHGLPISIKDTDITTGVRTTLGSLVFKDRVPDEDSIVVERVQIAGAISLGKTNMPEFGLVGTCENLLGDDGRNPWNTDRTPGGSSGGAAAATAAALCSMATGGDGGGSIRLPASFCGIYGIKPTQGRVPKYAGAQAQALPNLFSQSGPLTRTVRDSALFLQVMAGHDPRDPTTLREPPPNFLAALDGDIKGLRIGWSPDYGFGAVEPEGVESASKAAQVFAELGCSVEDSGLVLDSPYDGYGPIFSAAAYANHGNLLESHGDQLTHFARFFIEEGAKVTGADYNKALGLLDRLKMQFADLFDTYDLLLSPTLACTALPVGEFPTEIAGRSDFPNRYFSFFPFTYPINAVGHAAASIPCGFSSDGMPIGLHIVGRKGDEETVIAASAAFERARPWVQHRPPVS